MTGLRFSGTTDGHFVTYDTETGEKLWTYHLGAAIDGNPISWYDPGTENQYVAVPAGGSHPRALKGRNEVAVFSMQRS